ETARRLGVDKKTILRWARAEGIDPREIAVRVTERHQELAEAANARIAAERAAARERTIERLLKISDQAQRRELELLQRGGLPAQDRGAVRDTRRRAMEQVELLEGRATSRVDRQQQFALWVDRLLVVFQQALEDVEMPPELEERFRERFAFGARQL